MFIRIKKVKENKYAYLVKNAWTKAGVRQKTVKYFGRVYSLQQKSETSFEDMIVKKEIDINKLSTDDILALLIGYELTNHGFIKKKGQYALDDLRVNIKKRKVSLKGKSVVLGLNNDFLCNFTLRKLLNFKFQGNREEVGTELAKAFISAGIPVPEDVFVFVFSRIYREGGLSRVDSRLVS